MLNRLKSFRHNRLYLPGHLKKVLCDKLKLTGKTPTAEESLKKTFQWIEASFAATGDGGSSAYYSYSTGWKGSYPETTGYLIPTLYDYANYINSTALKSTARRAADWLLSIQHHDGGWQGLQIGVACEPRIFNTAMILDGLISVYIEEKDEKYLNSAKRGADWILSKLDSNYFFTQNNVVDGGSFDTLVCACLLMVNQFMPDEVRLQQEQKIRKSLDAHLTFQRDNYWFENCDFNSKDALLLHHLGYTLDGLMISSEILKDDSYYVKAKNTAQKLLSVFEINISLPAYFKSDWSVYNDLGNTASMCLTGCSQMAIVFQKIYKKEGDLRYLNAALKLNDIIASISNYPSANPGIRYGLSGSYPVSGGYQTYQFVNWAAKYHCESLLLSLNACRPKSILN